MRKIPQTPPPNHGFALISSMLILTLLVMIALASISLTNLESRFTKSSQAQLQARSNARLALNIALSQLQKYAGQDQRITARADITDPNWQNPTSSLVNPNYTYVWDTSGSELDLSPTTDTLTATTDSHRPGMRAGHDTNKKPAVLVSGNEQYNLAQTNGQLITGDYPEGYTTADSQLPSGKNITIVPADRILTPSTKESENITVPIVDLEENGAYAWWIGDESIKARINIDRTHAPDTPAAHILAQSPSIAAFDQGIETTSPASQKILSPPTSGIIIPSPSKKSFSLSPDFTTSSNSLLTDIRTGGLKQDLTYALFNPETAPNMPEELKDSQPLLDRVDAKIWGGHPGSGNSENGGISPYTHHLREFAKLSALDPSIPISIGTNGLTPVISQVQAGIHGAYHIIEGSKFQIYYAVFPSVALWNPHSTPIKLDKEIIIDLERRAGTSNWWLNLFRANYSLKNDDGSVTINNSNVFNNAGSARAGWNFRMLIEPDESIIIPPGQALVFSAKDNTTSSTPVASSPGESSKRTTHIIKIKPGWRPGKGHIFSLDSVIHDAKTFNTNGTFPKLAVGLGGVDSDNLLWIGRYQKADNSFKYFSYWSRLKSRTGSASPYFDPPLTTDLNQDARGSFPALLYKHGLRMGEQFLAVNPEYVHEDQSTLTFPYLSNMNPRSVYQAAIGDTYGNPNGATRFYTSEGTEFSPGLMGALYDHQSSRSIYAVPTTDDTEQYTYIGSGYIGPSQKMILANASSGIKPSYPNSASGNITSLTQLNNSQLTTGTQTPTGPLRYLWFSTSNYPAQPIGNSIADHRLNPLHKEVNSTNLTYIDSLAKIDNQNWRVSSRHYDISYLLNDRLYDRYFFSTIPQSGTYTPDEPLINARLKPATTDIDTLRQIKSAQHLTLQGGFNINSTSVEAWKMLLSSSLGNQLPGSPTPTESLVSFNQTASSTTSKKINELTTALAANGETATTLDQTQIHTLAQAIVTQIKRRGPFPNIASFVNRTNHLESLYRSDPQAPEFADPRFSGTIQAAIDTLTLFEQLNSQKTISPSQYVSDNRFYPGTEALPKSANTHLPGSLKQSDILSKIDPTITARGDTFTIRTVGIAKDINGSTIAKAACEATVQRTIEYMDDTQSPDTPTYTVSGNPGGSRTFTPNLNATNQKLGRRFIIKSFRWLPSQEVALMNIN